MSWNQILLEHRKHFDRNYVSCHEPTEREFIRVLITHHFPQLRKSKIEKVLTQACKEIESPRSREAFFSFIEKSLFNQSVDNPR